MASTSTQFQQDGPSLPSGSSSWKYDVFLSFRGADTRNGFVDHLYSALHEKVIFTFKDDPMLERGESISPALLKAIEESRFAVVVFSENYASSKWCLEELVKILERKKTGALTVLTVFYKVEPSDLRKQRRSVGKAFARHKRDSSEEEVQKWRNALTEVASICGWDSKTHRPEAKLVRDIAIDILNRLGHNGSSDLEDVVGLPHRVAKVMSLLEMESDLDDPRIVGICGMGGIGKTTIAKAVYHQIRTQFVGSCYLPNVRETVERHGLESLQKSLLDDIRSVLGSEIKIKNIDLAGSIRNAVGNKRVLVVLDDVNNSQQLDALVGTLDWFGRGSRIIITTRNSQLLAPYGPSSHVNNVEGLNDKEAFKLFCCKAFPNNQPTPGFEDLIKSVVDYAKGVPLALEVLGRLLIGKKVNVWQSAIDRLRKQPNRDIQNVLRLSYDELNYDEKQIFLDIACFFKMYSKDYSTIVNMLDACGFQAYAGISALEDKALVTISNGILIRNKTIDMHDLIQEMGWHIVNEESPKEPGGRSRLWKSKDIYHTLTKKTGTEAVETIVLDSYGTKKISLSPDAFSKMSKLRLLKLSNVHLPNGLDYLSNDLCLLDWQGYPLKYLPSNFQSDSLVTVNLSHSCLKFWNGRMGANLEELIFENCTNLVEISSIEAIKRLTVLNLRGSKNLKVLPSGICGLKLLESLDLSGCSKLSKLPENLGELKRLNYIGMKDCKELTSLPSGICGLKLLTKFDVSGCSKLRKLPENLGGLERLEHIGLKDCKELTSLPSGICGLKLLTELNVSGCSKLSKLPENLGGLERVKNIFLVNCKEFTSLPSGICGLKLTRLVVSGCSKLSELPENLGELEGLRYIDLKDCKELTSLPSGICGLKLLMKLIVSGCSKLSKLPENLGGLERLEDIGLEDCKELTSLPSGICGLKLLTELNVSGCSKLSKLPENLGELERLWKLEVDFTAIKQPPSSITHLEGLRYLSFKGCKGPLFSSEPGFELPALSALRALGRLDLRDCYFSEGFLPDDLGSLSRLKYLDLSGSNIISLPTSIRDLYELLYLDLRNCKKLESLPYLPTNIRLRIVACGCTSLKILTDPAIFLGQLDETSFTNCDTLLKNRPSLLLEFLRNILKKNKEEQNKNKEESDEEESEQNKNKEESDEEESDIVVLGREIPMYSSYESKIISFRIPMDWHISGSHIVVPGREIPKYFKYQNNMGHHYVRIQLMSDWYQRLRGFVVCAVFEARAPPMDDDRFVYAEC